MIERLPFELQRMPVIQDKVNELVDAVNHLQGKLAAISKMEKVEIPADNSEILNSQENVQDPYVEQLKWIGCVCRFWFDDPDETVLDYLDEIQKKRGGIEYYAKETYDWFPHCEPVKPDDDIIYRGE